jgi:hypothetical protein
MASVRAVSIRLAHDELPVAVGARSLPPFLATAGRDGRVHVVAVAAELDGDTFTVHGAGSTTLSNLTRNPAVTLAWAPPEPDGYSLVVDGVARFDGPVLLVRVTSAVLHRPAPEPGEG